MTDKPLFDEDQQAALGLMVDLMDRNAREANFLTNSLMEGYQEDAKKARAELKAVRMQITSLFADGYMPTENSIMAALIPDPDLVAMYMESKWI